MRPQSEMKKDLILLLRKFYDTPKAKSDIKRPGFFKKTAAEPVHHEACGRVIAALQELPDNEIDGLVVAFREYLTAQKSKALLAVIDQFIAENVVIAHDSHDSIRDANPRKKYHEIITGKNKIATYTGLKQDLIERCKKYQDNPKAGKKQNTHYEVCTRVIAALQELPDNQVPVMAVAFKDYLVAHHSVKLLRSINRSLAPYIAADDENDLRITEHFLNHQRAIRRSEDLTLSKGVAPVLYKIVLLGDANVGKTALAARWVENKYDENIDPTVSVQFFAKRIKDEVADKRFQIWDTSGQERYKSMLPPYIQNKQVVFICFDTTNKASFDHLENHINMVLAQHKIGSEEPASNVSSPKPEREAAPAIFLVATKTDLKAARKVSEAEINAFTEAHHLPPCLYTSAKDNTNISALFDTLPEKLVTESEQARRPGGPMSQGGR